jgi:hypothetical protein
MKTETYDNPADFLTALNGKPRQKRGRNTHPDIPSAPRASATGLTSLIAPERGSGNPAWSLAFVVGRGYRLYVLGGDQDTGWRDSEAIACAAARGMGR